MPSRYPTTMTIPIRLKNKIIRVFFKIEIRQLLIILYDDAHIIFVHHIIIFHHARTHHK